MHIYRPVGMLVSVNFNEVILQVRKMSVRVRQKVKRNYQDKAYLQVEYIVFGVFALYMVLDYLF